MTRALPGLSILLIALAGFCRAQENTPAADSEPAAAEAPSEVQSTAPSDTKPAAPSGSTPQKPFYKKLFTLQALYSTVPSAVVQQFHDWPDEWGKRRAGFEKRIGSLYGQFVIGSLIEDGVKAVHHEDTRYVRLGKGNFLRRTGHAVEGTFVARTPEGGGTPAFSLMANSYGSWAIATLWSPREFRTPGSILKWGSAGMGATVVTDVIREFWPDVKGLFHRKK